MRILIALLLVACGSSEDEPLPRPPRVPPADAAVARLAITAIAPDRGAVDGGTEVTITGSRFVKDGPRRAKVYFGAHAGVIVRFDSDAKMIVTAPPGEPGKAVDVVVIFEPGGELKLPAAFAYVGVDPLAGISDRMCACKDAGCATGVEVDMGRWAAAQDKTAPASKARTEQIARYTQCLVKLMAHAH